MKTTFMLKKEEVTRQWYVVDAANKPLGRVASEVAKLLIGKHKPVYTPNVDCGDSVIVINAEKAVLTGKKLEKKLYRHHSLRPGGLKEIQYKELMNTRPELAVETAVERMLPKNRIGRKMAKRLRIFRNAEHNMASVNPVEFKVNL